MQEHSSLANVVARTCFSDLPDDILFRIDYFLRKGGLGVLRLVKKSFAYASRGQYFRANEFAVFRNAAKHANLEILTKVYEFINCNGSEEVGGGGGTSGCGGETAALMKVKNFEAVKRCAVNSKTLAQDKVAVLATLHGWITALNGGQELIKGMLKLINEDSDYGVFCEAAKQVGGLEVMKLLYHWGSDQQKHGMRNAKRFECFRWAALQGDLAMMEQLYEWADFQEKSQMLCVADSNPMQQNNMGQVHFAFGPTGVMTIISNEPFFQQQPQQQQQDPQQPQQQQQPQMNTVFTQSLNPYYCFEIAAKKGHIHVLKKIWEWAEGATGSTATNTAFELTSNSRSSGNSLRHQMFSSGQYSAWAHACMSDNTEVLDRLWEFAKELQCQQQVLSVEDFGDFTQASQDGKINTIKKLLNFAASCGMSSDRVRQDMISARRFGPFLAAAQMNRPEALDILYEAATDIVEEQDLRSQMLEANNFEAFNCAVMKGHLQCVEKIYNWFSDYQKMAALGHLDCNAFRGTLLFGHLEMARLLWSFCNGDKFMEQAMIKSGGYGAFVEVLNCRSVSVSVKIDMLRQVFEWSSLEVQRAFFTIAVVMQVNLY